MKEKEKVKEENDKPKIKRCMKGCLKVGKFCTEHCGASFC